ncbi:MAG: DUF4175 family protein [Rhodospirillales bacterium]|nr:DUF4175 family protein [Rhodospirillales bacterium]
MLSPHEQERRIGRLPRQVPRSLKLTGLSLIAEALTAAFWPSLACLLLGLALALSGVLERFSAWLHLAVLAALLLGFLIVLRRGCKAWVQPGEAAVRHRAEQASALPDRPLTSVMDRTAAGSDPLAEALYRRHRARMHARLSKLRPAGPRPVLAARDRYALLPASLLLFLVALAAAGGDAWQRLAAAATPGLGASPAPPLSLEAWLDPPDYTRLAPIYLPAAGGGTVAFPAGSRLIAQVEGLEAMPHLRLGEAETAFATPAPGLHRLELPIEAGRRLVIAEGSRELAVWSIEVLPDRPPEAVIAGALRESDRKALVIPFAAKDDYGLESVTAELHLTEGGDGKPHSYILAAPEGSSAEAGGENYRDLTAHPWAGLDAMLTLLAEDGRGQTGRSASLPIVIPERIFAHPVAQQLMALRKRLSLAPQRRKPIARALDALLEQPQDFGHDLVAALAMIAAAARLEQDRRPEAVEQVQSLLWETALRIEEGDVSLLTQDLRDIRKQLQEALDRGAPEEEIGALLNRLEEAMQRYLQAMQEDLQRRIERGEIQPMELPENGRTIPAERLQQMLEELRALNEAGARDLAKQRLEQLQRLLENLRAAPFMPPDPSARQTLEQLRRLEGMLHRQQELLDRSYRAQQQAQQQQDQQDGQQPGWNRDGQSLSGNAPAQEALRRQLGRMLRDLAERLGEVPQNLGRAEQAMRRAGKALEGEDAQGAAEAQGEALSQMRRSLSGLAQRLSPQLGPQQDGRRGRQRDPLGREAGQGPVDSGENIGIPDAGELTRARELLEELRERRDDRKRPAEERDYMERLLDFF